MSEVLNKMPRRQRGRPPKHPWDKWGDGNIHSCEQGVDFHSEVFSFRALVHRSANARGLKAETSTSGKRVTFRFYDPALED